MKKLKLFICVSVIILASAFVAYKSINWKVKDDYSIQVYKGGAKCIWFKGLKAVISFDEEHPEKSKISATIDSNPIVEQNEALREGVKKPETLDVDKYPIISFESTSIIKKDNGYEATGNLTLKGIIKEIKLPFTFANEVFIGGFNIEAKDFNITNVNFQHTLQVVLKIPVSQ